MIDNLHVKRNKVDVFSHVKSSLYLFHVMPILYYTMLFPDVTSVWSEGTDLQTFHSYKSNLLTQCHLKVVILILR